MDSAVNTALSKRKESERLFMPKFKIAHVREQGVDLVIVPLESSFGHKTQDDQNRAITELRMRSNAAGLVGAVVPVWDNGAGRMAFIAPHHGIHFLEASVSLPFGKT
jgi:hypothetical protein